MQGPAIGPEFSGCKQQTLIQGNVGRNGVYGEDMSQVEWGIKNQAWTRARSIFSVSWGGSWDGGPVTQGVPLQLKEHHLFQAPSSLHMSQILRIKRLVGFSLEGSKI